MTERTIEAADDGVRLDRWFRRHYPLVSHGLMEKALRKGDVRVDGKKAKAADRLAKGQMVLVKEQYLPLKELAQTAKENEKYKVKPAAAKPEDSRMMQEAVLFKNADIIVINKPAGLAVQGGSKITKSVDSLLEALQFDAKERPKLVHRLDRDTSGVLVLARSAKVAAQLMPFFAGKKTQKIYWALVKGVPETYEGKIDLPLSKQETDDVEKVAVDEEDGKRAITHYRVLELLSRTAAWVELEPVTGRTHQLRVHMASIGHPIVGDGKYGGKEAFLEGAGISHKLHLHARSIMIPGMLDVVTAPLPKHMQESWKTLGLEED